MEHIYTTVQRFVQNPSLLPGGKYLVEGAVLAQRVHLPAIAVFVAMRGWRSIQARRAELAWAEKAKPQIDAVCPSVRRWKGEVETEGVAKVGCIAWGRKVADEAAPLGMGRIVEGAKWLQVDKFTELRTEVMSSLGKCFEGESLPQGLAAGLAASTTHETLYALLEQFDQGQVMAWKRQINSNQGINAECINVASALQERLEKIKELSKEIKEALKDPKSISGRLEARGFLYSHEVEPLLKEHHENNDLCEKCRALQEEWRPTTEGLADLVIDGKKLEEWLQERVRVVDHYEFKDTDSRETLQKTKFADVTDKLTLVVRLAICRQTLAHLTEEMEKRKMAQTSFVNIAILPLSIEILEKYNQIDPIDRKIVEIRTRYSQSKWQFEMWGPAFLMMVGVGALVVFEKGIWPMKESIPTSRKILSVWERGRQSALNKLVSLGEWWSAHLPRCWIPWVERKILDFSEIVRYTVARFRTFRG